MSENRESVLVVDDDESVRRVCERTLQGMGFDVDTAPEAESALARLAEKEFDLVLTDLAMPGAMDGTALTEEIRHRRPLTDVVIMTAYPALETAVPTLKSGATDYLIKPFEGEFLKSVVRRCFEKRRLSSELNREKRMREEIQAAYAELKKVERLKEGFLARVNHELRTPLVPAMLALPQIEAELASPKALKFFNALRSGLVRLRETIESLLLFSEIQKDDFRFYRALADVPKIIESVVDKYKPLWASRGLEVKLALDAAREPLWVSAKLMETLFAQLLFNAVQFNRKGGKVRFEAREEPEHMHFIVSDTGVGIAPEQLSRVFDSFYQAAEVLTRETGGLGLGLAVVRRITELHGGSVYVESEEGRGTSFHVLIPKREPFVEHVLRSVERRVGQRGDAEKV